MVNFMNSYSTKTLSKVSVILLNSNGNNTQYLKAHKI
jgi:hypothetical protein